MVRDASAASLPEKLRYRVERTEYAEIEVDVPLLLEEWREDFAVPEDADEEDVRAVLWQIGVQDLMWSGDFIKVLDRDTEENIEGGTAR